MTLGDASLPVLVLKTEDYGSLGVMRSLGRLGVQMYGVHPTRWPITAFSRYCRKIFTLDVEAIPAEQSVDALLEIAGRIGSRPLLMATNDATTLFVARNASRLKEGFLFPDNPTEVVWSLYNKKEMYFLAKRLSIPTAETVFPESREHVLEFCARAQFPVMLKASDGVSVSRRTREKMLIVRSKEDLIRYYDAMEDASNPSLMIQEYIPGTDATVWMFDGYFDEHSECRFGVTARKIHQTPVYTGMTALGVCLPCPDIEEATHALVKAVGYKGILDIGYRYDQRDRTFKLLDVNPRLGASFRLFVAKNGMDVARAQYLHFTGQPIPVSEMSIGRKWIVEDRDLVSCIKYYWHGVLTPRDWIAGYAGIQECAWFASDDIKPFLRMCSMFSVKPFRKILRDGKRLFRPTSELHAECRPSA
jgi:predicted ATP-grasp superfamily ATP-dependent carboligase